MQEGGAAAARSARTAQRACHLNTQAGQARGNHAAPVAALPPLAGGGGIPFHPFHRGTQGGQSARPPLLRLMEGLPLRGSPFR